MRDQVSSVSVSDPNRSRERNRNRRQQEVTIAAMRKSSTPPRDSGSSSSPSIKSVETSSTLGSGSRSGSAFGTPGSRGESIARDDFLAPVITAMASTTLASTPAPLPVSADRSGNGNGTLTGSSRASSSSWSTTAPSAASAASVGVQGTQQDLSERLYACLFHVLDCHDSFDDVVQWKTHVLSHFRTHPPPRTARCPLCPDTEFIDEGDDESFLSPLSLVDSGVGTGTNITSDTIQTQTPESIPTSTSSMQGTGFQTEDAIQDFESAWTRMLDHVATVHYQRGETLAGSRPDFELMRYLYGRRIISDAQFKAMQLAPAPSSPAYHRSQDRVRASIGSSDEPYYAPYSRRREERLRNATRGVSVVQV